MAHCNERFHPAPDRTDEGAAWPTVPHANAAFTAERAKVWLDRGFAGQSDDSTLTHTVALTDSGHGGSCQRGRHALARADSINRSMDAARAAPRHLSRRAWWSQ